MTLRNLLFAPLPNCRLLAPSWLSPRALALLQLEFTHAGADALYASEGTGKTAALRQMAAQLEAQGARALDAAPDINSATDKDCP